MISNRPADIVNFAGIERIGFQNLPCMVRSFDGVIFLPAFDVVEEAGALYNRDSAVYSVVGLFGKFVLNDHQSACIDGHLDSVLKAMPKIFF